MAEPAGNPVLDYRPLRQRPDPEDPPFNFNLWHLARPTTSAGRRRRLPLYPYTPAWLQPAPYGPSAG